MKKERILIQVDLITYLYFYLVYFKEEKDVERFCGISETEIDYNKQETILINTRY